MRITYGKTPILFGLLTFGGTLRGVSPREFHHKQPLVHTAASQTLMIRVSQESSPGAGDFDQNTLGFIQALQTTAKASDFYRYQTARYGNKTPQLAICTSHLFFVNARDGLSFFVVQNNGQPGGNDAVGGTADMHWELSGGTAHVLLTDDGNEATESGGGTIFTGHWNWGQPFTDGMVVGSLPVGFTLVGQFTTLPTGLNNGWEAMSRDGSIIKLRLVPGQRVRLDVALHVRVRQDH